MKRKTTKEILAESYLELAERKSINRISVVDIVENCSMTKPTFYRYFKDKYDLISWLFVRATKENLDRIGTDGCVWIDTLLDGIRCYEQNRKYVVNALKHTSGRESFLNIINETEIEYIELEIKKKIGKDTVPENLSSIVKIYCYGSGQYICEWLMGSKPAPCELEEKVKMLNEYAIGWYSSSQADYTHEAIFRAQGFVKFADRCKEEGDEELEEARKCTARVVSLGGQPAIGYVEQPLFCEIKDLLKPELFTAAQSCTKI